MTKVKKLNLNQRKFVYKYLQTGNATKSTQFAYPNVSYESAQRFGSEMLTYPHIQAEIEKAFQKLQQPVIKDIKNLITLANSEKLKDLPTASDVINANVQLLKLRGAYNKNNVNVNVSISAKLEQMTDEELKQNLQELKARNTRILENP